MAVETKGNDFGYSPIGTYDYFIGLYDQKGFSDAWYGKMATFALGEDWEFSMFPNRRMIAIPEIA